MDSEIIKETNPTYMTNGKHSVKCLGLEDIWGNGLCILGGIIISTRYRINDVYHQDIKIMTNNFSSNYSDFKDILITSQRDSGGLISAVLGSSKEGFLPKTFSGSASTYFCDYSSIYNSYTSPEICVIGGSLTNTYVAGIFSTQNNASTSNNNARLMYL